MALACHGSYRRSLSQEVIYITSDCAAPTGAHLVTVVSSCDGIKSRRRFSSTIVLTASSWSRRMTAVFGYGSLIFKPPPFANLTSEAGYIQGFVRRFAQDSHDHRGTEENPGRGKHSSCVPGITY